MNARTTTGLTGITGATQLTGLQGAELAYRRERIVRDFQAINAAARRRSERRARRAAAVAPGPIVRWLRVHQHATR